MGQKCYPKLKTSILGSIEKPYRWGQVPINVDTLYPRVITGIVLVLLYPLLIQFKFFDLSRFYLTLIVPLATYYGPLITGNYGAEFYIKGSYQPLVCLLLTLWALHPKKDATLFWLSIIFHAPFTTLTPYIGELIKPGSILEELSTYPIAFTVTPAFFYGACLLVGIQIMKSRENSLDSMHSSNKMMLKVIEDNEKIQTQLQNEIKTFDNKFQKVLLTNSHDLRLPVSNLMGLMSIIENDINEGKLILPDHLLGHLKTSVHSLEQSVNSVNETLDKNQYAI